MAYKFGILGGIGPETSAIFYHGIISDLQKTGIINDNRDYPQIIINSIPAPELTGLNPPSCYIKPYIEGIKELLLHKPKFIVMACNTIHLYLYKIIQ